MLTGKAARFRPRFTWNRPESFTLPCCLSWLTFAGRAFPYRYRPRTATTRNKDTAGVASLERYPGPTCSGPCGCRGPEAIGVGYHTGSQRGRNQASRAKRAGASGGGQCGGGCCTSTAAALGTLYSEEVLSRPTDQQNHSVDPHPLLTGPLPMTQTCDGINGRESMNAPRTAVELLVQVRRDGGTLRQAAIAAGVHVATVCRWQARDQELRQALADAAEEACLRRSQGGPRRHVTWRRDCPMCKARVVVRTARGKLTFWRCGRWPLCSWASWRPRAPRNCRRCGAPCYWSHSRKSIGCSACGMRTMTL